MKLNFYPSLLVISGIILCYHYSTLASTSNGCPVIVAMGQPETGKTKSLLTALSLVGKDIIYYSCSIANYITVFHLLYIDLCQ